MNFDLTEISAIICFNFTHGDKRKVLDIINTHMMICIIISSYKIPYQFDQKNLKNC